MGIKTRKIKLIPVAEDSKGRTKIYNFVKELSKEMATVGNRVIRHHVNNGFEVEKLKAEQTLTKGKAIEILTEMLGASPQNSGYNITTDMPHISSNVRVNFNQMIYKTISENFYDILTNKVSIPSYKSVNLPIPTSKKVYVENGTYIYDFPGTKHTKEMYGDIKFELYFGKDKSNNKVIVDRTIDETYKMCTSTIQYDGKDIFLYMVVNIPNQIKDVDPNKVMGIDLGINRPVTMYITDEKRQPQQININDKIQHDRMRMMKQRRSLQQSLKYAKGGHGRAKKTKSMEDFREKESHWAQTINHTISANVIKTALEYNVGVIKMEDLTGITTNKNDYFFKSWGYYQLQNYIKYKAEQVGIKIKWINPMNTSRECPTCNNVHEENRSKVDVTKFACVNTKCKDYLKVVDADVVGATNISNREGLEDKPKSKAARLKKTKKVEKILEEDLVV
jgi:IS605 OrfB family transposase